MAKIRDYAITINTVATASLVCEMPVHATGDVLLAFLNKDSTTGFAGTGWNALQAQNSAGAHGAVWTKRATSSSETITFTLTLETCLAVVVAVKNAEAEINSGLITINCNSAGTYTRTAGSFTTDGFEPGQSVLFSGNTSAGNNVIKIISTITGAGTIITVTDATGMVTESGNGDERAVSTGVDVTAVTGADDLTFPLAGATMTPIDNNCLLFDWLSTDIGIGPSALPGWVNIFTGDAGANSGCLSYTYQKTAASVTHSGHWGGVTSTAADSRAFMIAIRDNGSETEVDPYVDRATVGSAVVSSIVGVTGEIDAGTWATTALSLATVGAKSTTFDAIATVADSGYIPFWGSASFTPATSTTNLVGSELGLTTATDMQTGSPLLFGTWNFLTPRDYVDLGKASTGGLIIAVADSTNDYKAWTIGGQFDKTTNPDKRNKFAIQVNQTTSTTYGASGTLNNVNKVLYLAAGVYGAVAWRGSNLSPRRFLPAVQPPYRLPLNKWKSPLMMEPDASLYLTGMALPRRYGLAFVLAAVIRSIMMLMPRPSNGQERQTPLITSLSMLTPTQSELNFLVRPAIHCALPIPFSFPAQLTIGGSMPAIRLLPPWTFLERAS